VMKGATNQAIRFTMVNQFKKVYKRRFNQDAKPLTVFGIGAFAGMTSVCVTQPLDTVKSNMQGLDQQRYKGSLDCARQIYGLKGIGGFYRGVIPRLVRVSIEVGVLFSCFDVVSNFIEPILDRHLELGKN